MKNFIPIEELCPTWPTVRADIEPLVPEYPEFVRSAADPSRIELNQAWAIMMVAHAPDQASFDALLERINWLGTVNAAALQACRLDQYTGMALTVQNIARINDNVMRQDAFRRTVNLPSFKDLARDVLGLQSIIRPLNVTIQVKPNDTLH